MSGVLKISDAASLAMHTMVLMAMNPDEVLTTHGIASRLKVSEAHLSKVLQRLTHQGLVKSLRGPKGGFRTEKPLEAVTLLDVYEAIEGTLQPVACLLDSKSCNGSGCILGVLLSSVNRQVRDYLAGTRLSELSNIYGRNNHEQSANHPN